MALRPLLPVARERRVPIFIDRNRGCNVGTQAAMTPRFSSSIAAIATPVISSAANQNALGQDSCCHLHEISSALRVLR